MLSRIGLGTGDFFWNAPIGDIEKIAIISTAVDRGITFIDTAEGYGNSEFLVGQAVKQAIIGKYSVISTKFSPEHNSFMDVIISCILSRRRLRTDALNVFSLHWTNPQVPLKETLLAMRFVIQLKWAWFAGICNLSRKEIETAIGILKRNLLTAQYEYNLFEQTVEKNGTLQLLKDSKIVPVAYSPLDQGRMQMSPMQKDALESIAKRYGNAISIQQIILSWIMSKGFIPIVRTTNMKHIQEIADCLHFSISEDDCVIISKAFPFEIVDIPPEEIDVDEEGEWNHQVYKTLEEARDNKFNFCPSPMELSKSLKQGNFLKPIRVRRNGSRYSVIGGRIKYWAWRIAFENKSIPSVVRE